MNKLSGGTVYQLSIHLVLVTKYRRQVIHAAMLQRLKDIFAATCEKWDCRLTEFSGESDHVHMLIEINPKVQISAFANNLKTVSSRLIRKKFPERVNEFYSQPVFWKMATRKRLSPQQHRYSMTRLEKSQIGLSLFLKPASLENWLLCYQYGWRNDRRSETLY